MFSALNSYRFTHHKFVIVIVLMTFGLQQTLYANLTSLYDSLPMQQRDGYRITSDESCNTVASGVGLPIWVMGGIGMGDYVFDWRGATKKLQSIGSSPISTENRETAVGIDECGKPAFYLMHTGQSGNLQLDIYTTQGVKLTQTSTASKYPLNDLPEIQKYKL
jgi:hypothetical protein